MAIAAATSHIFASGTVQIAAQRVGSSWTWYIIRAAGFTAAGLLILLMLSGIGQVTGLTYRFLEPIKAWALHKAMAFALCAAVVVHVAFLLIDRFMPFSLSQVLVPFVSHYSNGSTLFGLGMGAVGVALGILAAYGIVLLVLSSLTLIDTKQKTWRWLHYLGYFVIMAVFLHALAVGSDLKYGTFRAAWVAMFLVLVLAVIHRLLRAGTVHRNEEESSE